MKINGSQGSFGIECAVSSVVEHFLDTEGVRGSNPLSRTIANEIKSFIALSPSKNSRVITLSHNKSPRFGNNADGKIHREAQHSSFYFPPVGDVSSG
jgi:hypothetical protein